MGGC